MVRKNTAEPFLLKLSTPSGFTLVELLIAMVVAIIIGTAMVANYISQQRSATIVRQVAHMQQQLRGAMFILEHDIRLAGYDPTRTQGLFGLNDVQRRDMETGALELLAGQTLTVTYDWSLSNPAWRDNGAVDLDERITYGLFDETGNGITDLVRVLSDNYADRQLVAENIEAMAVAFAYLDGNGDLARDGDDIIWAIDTTNTNALNSRLMADGTLQPLATPVGLDRIRMARVWLLARAQNPSPEFVSPDFQVGDQLVPGGDGFRRRLLERTLELRNTGII